MKSMMRRGQELGTLADWLVCAKHNRCLSDQDGDKLSDVVTNGAAPGYISSRCRPEAPKKRVRYASNCGRAVEISDGKRRRISTTCIIANESRRE